MSQKSTLKPDNSAHLRISYYKAPSVHAVTPITIPPRTELVEIVTEGVVYFQHKKSMLKLGCGALFWHRPGEKTICQTEPSSPYECLCIRFAAHPGTKRRADRLSLIADRQKARELCRELLHAYHDVSIDRRSLCEYARSRLLWEAYLGTIQRPTAIQPPLITTVISHMEYVFRQPSVGVQELAKAAGISEPHLYSLFRRHLNQTPSHCLAVRRIKEAKLLLSGSSQTIKSIALECGFLNIETFYRVFKKHMGTTPNLFRTHNSQPILEKI